MTSHQTGLLRRAALTLTATLAASVATWAQDVGEYGFLQLPVSARAAALGGTAITVVEPELALADQNPSLLCPETGRQVAMSYMNYVGDINLAWAGYGGRFLSQGGWMASMRYVGYGDFDGRDEYGSPTGTFSAKDIALTLGLGHALNDKWRIGGSLRGIYTKYESYTAFALAADVGLNYYNEVTGRSISLTATNLGGQLKQLEGRKSDLHPTLNAGWTKELDHLPFSMTLLAYDLLSWDQKYTDGDGAVHERKGGELMLCHLLLGAEWMPTERFWLGGSYNYRRQRQYRGMGGWLRGVSLGAGVTAGAFTVQCAYGRYNAADGSLSVELSYRF